MPGLCEGGREGGKELGSRLSLTLTGWCVGHEGSEPFSPFFFFRHGRPGHRHTARGLDCSVYCLCQFHPSFYRLPLVPSTVPRLLGTLAVLVWLRSAPLLPYLASKFQVHLRHHHHPRSLSSDAQHTRGGRWDSVLSDRIVYLPVFCFSSLPVVSKVSQ